MDGESGVRADGESPEWCAAGVDGESGWVVGLSVWLRSGESVCEVGLSG